MHELLSGLILVVKVSAVEQINLDGPGSAARVQ
jgi:hypothetical protein